MTRYPDHTRKERLKPFLELSTFKKDSFPPSFVAYFPPSFVAYCQQAKQQQLAQQASTGVQCSDIVHVGDVTATVLKIDTLHVKTNDILSSLQLPDLAFAGINLAVLDPPEVYTVCQCHQYVNNCTTTLVRLSNRPLYKGHCLRSQVFTLPIVVIHLQPLRRG